MMIERLLAVGFCMVLAGCAAGQAPPPAARVSVVEQKATAKAGARTEPAFTFVQLGEFMQLVARHDAKAQRTEVARLQSLAKPDAGDRLRLAYLLSLDNASPEDLTLAQEQLQGLELLFEDSATREFVRLLQRMLTSKRAINQEKKRVEELQEKLRQLKKLELELQERSQAKPPQGK
jgi:hypothetical protein